MNNLNQGILVFLIFRKIVDLQANNLYTLWTLIYLKNS